MAFTWLPLFLLATVGPFAGSAGRLAFLRGIEVHARFLVALPAFIVAELIVHLRMLPVVRRFVERRIISLEELPRFYRAVESAFGLRNSIALELVCSALCTPSDCCFGMSVSGSMYPRGMPCRAGGGILLRQASGMFS